MSNHPQEPTTRQLEHTLLEIDDTASLGQYLHTIDQLPQYDSFIAYYQTLEKVQNMTPSGLQKASAIERSYYYHVMDGTKHPGRDKILRLCLAAGLDDDETRRALEAGGVQILYARSRRDAVIQYAIVNHLSVIETNILLEQYRLDPLA